MRSFLRASSVCVLLACGCGQADFTSQTVVPAPGDFLAGFTVENVGAVAQDDQALYFTVGNGPSRDALYRLAKDGSSPPQSIAPVPSAVLAHLAVDDTRVYVSDGFGQQILGVDKVTGETAVLASNQPFASDIAIDADHIYWVTLGAIGGPGPVDGTVMSLAKNGAAAPTTLVAQSLSPAAIAIDDAYVYWLDGVGTTEALRRIPKAGGEVEVLAGGPFMDYQPGFAVTDGFVLWESDSQCTFGTAAMSTLSSVPVAGGPVGTISLPCARVFTTDTSFVYVGDDSDAVAGLTLARVRVAGGNAQPLVTLPSRGFQARQLFTAILVDACHVYAVESWAGNPGGSTFHGVTKPTCAP
jgi:hypothetical protein